MSHLIDMFGQLAMLAPYPLLALLLCLSVRSFWNIGSNIARSKSSPSEAALYISPPLDVTPGPALEPTRAPPLPRLTPPDPRIPSLLPPASPARGLPLAYLLLWIVATFGVLWTYSKRACWWRNFDSVCLHSRTFREAAARWGHSDIKWPPPPLRPRKHFSRDLSETERWMIAEANSSHLSVKREYEWVE